LKWENESTSINAIENILIDLSDHFFSLAKEM